MVSVSSVYFQKHVTSACPNFNVISEKRVSSIHDARKSVKEFYFILCFSINSVELSVDYSPISSLVLIIALSLFQRHIMKKRCVFFV